MEIWEYFTLGAAGILCVFCIAIGVEKMMKIVFGNYLLTALCLAMGPTIDAIMGWFGTQNLQESVGFLFTNKTIVTLVVYLLMLVLIFTRSRLVLGFRHQGVQKVFLTIICIPLTILSIGLTLEIAILGSQTFNPIALQGLVSNIAIADVYKNFIVNTPIIIAIHAFVTILILSKINFFPARKTGILPDIHIED